jgi:hypothetical protein
MAKKKVTKTEQGIHIPIKWHTSDKIISRYASNVLVHALENEFLISFFEIKPEIRLDSNTPLPKEAHADCVANIILSPNKIPAFIKVLQKQYDKYVERLKEPILANEPELPS